MAFFTNIADDASQSISGGFLNRSFNRNREDNRSIDSDLDFSPDLSDNSDNSDNSTRNRGFFTGNTISISRGGGGVS